MSCATWVAHCLHFAEWRERESERLAWGEVTTAAAPPGALLRCQERARSPTRTRATLWRISPAGGCAFLSRPTHAALRVRGARKGCGRSGIGDAGLGAGGRVAAGQRVGRCFAVGGAGPSGEWGGVQGTQGVQCEASCPPVLRVHATVAGAGRECERACEGSAVRVPVRESHHPHHLRHARAGGGPLPPTIACAERRRPPFLCRRPPSPRRPLLRAAPRACCPLLPLHACAAPCCRCMHVLPRPPSLLRTPLTHSLTAREQGCTRGRRGTRTPRRTPSTRCCAPCPSTWTCR